MQFVFDRIEIVESGGRKFLHLVDDKEGKSVHVPGEIRLDTHNSTVDGISFKVVRNADVFKLRETFATEEEAEKFRADLWSAWRDCQ